MRSTIIKAQNGDKLAALTLVKKYKPLILKYSTTFHLNNYTVEDLIQEGNMAVLKAISKYDINRDVNSFDGYIIMSIRNCYNMLARKHIKYNEESSLNIYTSDNLCIIDILEDTVDIEKEYIHNWDYKTLKESLFLLSDKEKAMIYEIYFKKDGSLRKYCLHYGITFYYGKKQLTQIINKLKASLL